IAEGGTLGLFGDPRVGKLVLVEELAHNLRGRRGQPAIFTFIKAPEEVGVYTELLGEVGPLRTAVLAAEGATESALAAARPFLDAAVFMTRPLVEGGIYPAVDPQRSWSRLLNPHLWERITRTWPAACWRLCARWTRLARLDLARGAFETFSRNHSSAPKPIQGGRALSCHASKR